MFSGSKFTPTWSQKINASVTFTTVYYRSSSQRTQNYWRNICSWNGLQIVHSRSITRLSLLKRLDRKISREVTIDCLLMFLLMNLLMLKLWIQPSRTSKLHTKAPNWLIWSRLSLLKIIYITKMKNFCWNLMISWFKTTLQMLYSTMWLSQKTLNWG